MMLECREIDQNTVQLECGNLITDGFLGIRCGRFDRETYLLKNGLNVRRTSRDVIVH